ncbi:MAG: ATP-binding protein [Pirellulales bacterium]|nr:ATP-binding protein [Pirellulales bacterium]
MKIAIASGKGGTGKTTVATSLAYVAASDGHSVAYLDCDVEEPNGHLFLKPQIIREEPIRKWIPVVDPDRCTHCGLCSQACRYGAIACVGEETLIFTELCHSCGGCLLVCPEDAIREVPKPIGRLRTGKSGQVEFVEGVLDVGEAMSPPAIQAVKDTAPDVELILYDCPPGTSCPVIESVRGCDLLLLVTEPTPFGLHDLKLAVEMARALKLRFGVVINRADMGDREVWDYCSHQRIAILAEIPDELAVAEAYSRGEMAAESVPRLAEQVRRLLEMILSGAPV